MEHSCLSHPGMIRDHHEDSVSGDLLAGQRLMKGKTVIAEQEKDEKKSSGGECRASG